jgi:hypothetical protein
MGGEAHGIVLLQRQPLEYENPDTVGCNPSLCLPVGRAIAVRGLPFTAAQPIVFATSPPQNFVHEALCN